MLHLNIQGMAPPRCPFGTGTTVVQIISIYQRGHIEMKKPTILSNKTSTAWSCVEDQILENKNLRNMILNICAEHENNFSLREHTWFIGLGGVGSIDPIGPPKNRQGWTLIVHERAIAHFWVLPGSLFSITEITEYKYFSLL